jgi:hypothetical protein
MEILKILLLSGLGFSVAYIGKRMFESFDKSGTLKGLGKSLLWSLFFWFTIDLYANLFTYWR